jgi:hypothetical protein
MRPKTRFSKTQRFSYVGRFSNMLAPFSYELSLGSLDKVMRVVRIGVFIATSGDFFDQPRVADAVSDLFRDVFGSEKIPVRLVIGVASLPLGMPIELEVIFEVKDRPSLPMYERNCGVPREPRLGFVRRTDLPYPQR